MVAPQPLYSPKMPFSRTRDMAIFVADMRGADTLPLADTGPPDTAILAEKLNNSKIKGFFYLSILIYPEPHICI